MPNRTTHSAAGTIVGGGLALKMSRGQKPQNRLIETAGGAIAGNFFGRLPDILEPADHPRHRRTAHAVLPSVTIGVFSKSQLNSWQTSLRNLADRHEILKEQALDEISHFWHAFLEFFFRLLAGAVPGAIAGYGSHLLLDAFTPQSLPLIA